MYIKKIIASLIFVTLFVPLQTYSHDKCDSLAFAATAAGVLWPPSAGFQVGYFLAKQIDESTASASSTVKSIDPVCAATSFGDMNATQYARIVSPAGEDPNQQYKFLWDASGELAKKSLALNEAIVLWQAARVELREALLNGDAVAAANARIKMNEAHASAAGAFELYRLEHSNYAGVAELASGLLITGLPPSLPDPLLTVDGVVQSAENILSNGAPAFEVSYFTEVGCVLPEAITPAGILAPIDRFVNDDVAPGTFIDDSMLVSASRLYAEVSGTFGGEVAAGLDKILPEGFANNEPLPLLMEVITEGRILQNDLGIEEGQLQHTSFMLDLNQPTIAPLTFLDPWQWHWIVGKPWDWLFGFEVQLIPDGTFVIPGQPQPQPSDVFRLVAKYDGDNDQVMGLGIGSQFVQELHFADGSLGQAMEESRIPNASEMGSLLGGSLSIFDESGNQRLDSSIHKVDPNPQIQAITLAGSVGENQLGVLPGTLQRASLMLDLRLTPVAPGIFIDPWWWHWVVGRTPWDWLRGFDIVIETNVPRPGDPNPWDRMRIVTTFDEPQLDSVMELPVGSRFIQELYFPLNSLSVEALPTENSLLQFSGGDFQIVDPSGNKLLVGNFESLVLEAVDSDEDGIDDFTDNCAATSNKDQRDTDGDGYGNDCDGDLNNDGIVNTRDLGIFKTEFGSSGTGLDADLNGDGVVNTRDLGVFKTLFGKPPGPSAVGMLL